MKSEKGGPMVQRISALSFLNEMLQIGLGENLAFQLATESSIKSALLNTTLVSRQICERWCAYHSSLAREILSLHSHKHYGL